MVFIIMRQIYKQSLKETAYWKKNSHESDFSTNIMRKKLLNTDKKNTPSQFYLQRDVVPEAGLEPAQPLLAKGF